MKTYATSTSTLLLGLTLVGLATAPRVIAQAPSSGLAMGIVQARQQNATQMKGYSWNCRVEVIENGTVKDTRIDQVTYGPDGNLQYTLLNDHGAPLPGGFLRRKIAQAERDKLETYIKDVRALLNQYTLPTAAGVGAFLAAANIQAPDANGVLQISGFSVVVPGDSLTLSVYAPTRQPRQMKVMTTSDGDEVTLSASFKTLSSGLNYLNYATVTIPAKNLTIQVQNYDYINQSN